MKNNIITKKAKISFVLFGFLIFSTLCSVQAQYTLTDNDVVVTQGVITSCSYNFETKNINIPQTLDGQTVTGIANASYSSAGVFYNKGITALTLPASIKTIGDYAFYNNAIANLNLSVCTLLTSIGNYAFYFNGITSLNLSTCPALTTIGASSFFYNKIATLNLTGCTALTTIGESAFYSDRIISLNLSPCKALSSIGASAFSYNSLTALDISGCSSLIYIGNSAFSGNTSLTGFALPDVTYKGTVYKTWADGTGKSYTAGVNQATDFATFYIPLIPYILTDNDVVVENGIIKSCSYSFELRNIVIPPTLDGQTVTGIVNAAYTSAGVFYNKGIISVQLPTTIQSIGDYAFYDNSLTKLSFTGCTALTYLGKWAFYSNDFTTVDFTPCTALTTIGDYAFYSNKLTSLNLSDCKALSSIGPYAFYFNSIAVLNISGCRSLFNIGSSAFSGNSSLIGFDLPEVTYKGSVYKTWEDGTGKGYTAGVDRATNLNTSYTPVVPYTLTDNDVVVENGIIKSCSYNFELKYIIIPASLDGQTVTGTASGSYSGSGVFYNKGILSLTLPATIQSIGDYAFYDNSITKLNITGCTALNSIGKSAFYSNELSNLDLSTCAALTTISASSFGYNKIASLSLPVSGALITIGESAFNSNKITSLDLSPFKALSSIGASAFYYNLLATLDITGCKSLISIGSDAFAGNYSLKGFALPEVTYKGTVYKIWEDGTGKSYTAGADQATNLNTFYLPLIPYTLSDNDVVVENGIIKSCSYNFELRNIVIPSVLDGQKVVGIAGGTYSGSGVFYNKGITSLQLPTTLQIIGDYAFYDNTITKLNVTGCTALTSIGKYAFYSNDLTSVELANCTGLATIGTYAFYSNKLATLNLSGCKALTVIESNAFGSNSLSGFILPEPAIVGYILNQWKDDTGSTYSSGTQVTNFSKGYTAKMVRFCKDNFFAEIINSSQAVNMNLTFNCPVRGMEIANMTFDDNKFGLNVALPIKVASGDSSFIVNVKMANPETRLCITRYEVTYKMDGQTKTFSDFLHVATIKEDNSELGIVGKRAIKAYNFSIDSNLVATLNNRGVIYRLLGYPDLAKPLFDNAVGLALSKFYAFTGIKMNQGVVESDRVNTAGADSIYENALNDIGLKKDSSVLAPQIFYNQAWELYMNENFTGAEILALKTLNHTKANAWLKAKAAALLGAVKYKKGDQNGAVAAFQTAYTIDGNGPIGTMARENMQLITAAGELSFKADIQVYPQPASDYLVIEYKGQSLQKVTVELSDLSGKIVHSGHIQSSASGFYHSLDVNSFPAGIYNLKLVSHEFIRVFKIIVQ